MTATRTNTATATHTVSISSSDVRIVMQMITADIMTVCHAAAEAARSFNLDEALVDASLLVLNGIAAAINLEIHKDGVVVRGYRFELCDGQPGTSGPPAGQPPLGYVPPGSRIRLSVTPDLRVPAAERQAWFDRLGWRDAEPLTYDPGTVQTAYGSFQSGGMGVQRHLKSNPKYDRPI